jgi:hypothetical protein
MNTIISRKTIIMLMKTGKLNLNLYSLNEFVLKKISDGE